MLYLIPENPLKSYQPKSDKLPDKSILANDGITFIQTRISPLAIHGPTGSWSYLSEVEVELVKSFIGCTPEEVAAKHSKPLHMVRKFAECLWQRGVLSSNGHRVIDTCVISNEIESNTLKSFFLLLVMSSGCNLSCTYCYLYHTNKSQNSIMPLSIGLDVINKALSRPEPQIIIDFGEIAGTAELFCALVHHARKNSSNSKKALQLLIQTNGTTINRKLTEFLLQMNISVGVSLDGPAKLNDLARRYQNLKGAYEHASKGLHFLAMYDVPYWVIVTIGRHNVKYSSDVLYHLWDIGVNNYVFKPVMAIGRGLKQWEQVGIEPKEYDNFLIDTVKLSLSRSVEFLDITRRKFLLRVLGDTGGWINACTSRNCLCGSNWVVVGHDGKWAPCPRFAGLREDSTKEYKRSRKHTIGVDMPASISQLPKECYKCSWQKFCGGGCALSEPNEHLCGDYRASFELIFKEIIPHIIEKKEIQTRSIGHLKLIHKEFF